MARVIELSGTVNFRDFGGYGTAHGRRVRTERLFRCGHLANLSDSGRAGLLALGIGVICDLRFPEERDAEPTPIGHQEVERVEVPMDPGSAVSLRAALDDEALSLEDRIRFMESINRELAIEHAADYRRVFEALLGAGERGFLVHCTAGKDRTGLAAALIKLALGVSEADVIHDYLFTNEVIDFEGFVLPRWQARRPRTTLADVRALSGVQEGYIRAAFDAIEAEFGSIDAYLADALGLHAPERRELEVRYLV